MRPRVASGALFFLGGMEEWYVIVNPVSGRGRGAREWPLIESLLTQAGFDYTFNFSSSKYEAIDLAESAVLMGYRKIIVVGGDGTMHEVLNGLYRQHEVPMSSITVGVIPIGTGNDWVRHFGIPHDYKQAIDVIAAGRIFHQDVIRARYQTPQGVGERVVANIAGIGLDASVIEAVDAAEKRGHKGRWTYLWCLIKTVMTHKAKPYEVEIDGRRLGYPEMFSAAVGNNRFNGGGLEQLPAAKADDGLAEIMILKALSLRAVPQALKRLLTGRINDIPEVENYRGRCVVFSSPEPRPIELDGELVGTTQAEFEVISGALNVIVPQNF